MTSITGTTVVVVVVVVAAAAVVVVVVVFVDILSFFGRSEERKRE